MVSQGRCAIGNGAQGSQGLFWGMVSQGRCAIRNRTQWVARAVLGEWYRKFATLTATKKWGAGATLLSAMGRKGCSRGMVSQVRCAHRNRTQWVARAVLEGWYRKVAALTGRERLLFSPFNTCKYLNYWLRSEGLGRVHLTHAERVLPHALILPRRLKAGSDPSVPKA